ncbi:DoxX family membrane protein [Nocardioides sp. MAH-18]|uniref:DoxX family membrane protein n=1 Tax=Nocardioides agri TaxID=2682843 RepID=A0A6L6XKJ7_9ACTN|nr:MULTISPECIES: DoxX family protein [unclassified Nocardioides]MBA2956658.1 DoxX family protein [Nocardioides sp. CGMCC 1.13656]MVQ47801.1 DoxX family membrane protein [Nocardioides sp. MAH-18]
MTVSRLIARPMLASIFVVGAAAALKNTAGPAVKADPVTSRLVPLARKAGIPLPEDPETLVKINAGVQIGAGLALATGRAPRISAAVLAASLVPTTLAGHRFWEFDDATQRTQQRLHFFKNVSLVGGLIIASGDTEGQPGVAWRARRAARDARREARRLAHDARREARLAASRVR